MRCSCKIAPGPGVGQADRDRQIGTNQKARPAAGSAAPGNLNPAGRALVDLGELDGSVTATLSENVADPVQPNGSTGTLDGYATGLAARGGAVTLWIETPSASEAAQPGRGVKARKFSIIDANNQVRTLTFDPAAAAVSTAVSGTNDLEGWTRLGDKVMLTLAGTRAEVWVNDTKVATATLGATSASSTLPTTWGLTFRTGPGAGEIPAGRKLDGWDNFSLKATLPQTRFGYTGAEWDPETGLYHLGPRLYDPKTGRFLQQDPNPPTFEDARNPYRYAWGDPVNYTDPSGMSAFRSAGSAIRSGIGGAVQSMFGGALSALDHATAGAAVAIAPSVVGAVENSYWERETSGGLARQLQTYGDRYSHYGKFTWGSSGRDKSVFDVLSDAFASTDDSYQASWALPNAYNNLLSNAGSDGQRVFSRAVRRGDTDALAAFGDGDGGYVRNALTLHTLGRSLTTSQSSLYGGADRTAAYDAIAFNGRAEADRITAPVELAKAAIGAVPIVGTAVNYAVAVNDRLGAGQSWGRSFGGGAADVTGVTDIRNGNYLSGGFALAGTAFSAAASFRALRPALTSTRNYDRALLTTSCFVAGTDVLAGKGDTIDIEDIHVGRRVATDGGVANSRDGKTKATDADATQVDPKTWRKVTIAVDDWQIESLQTLADIKAYGEFVGGAIELSTLVDLAEMGAPEGLTGSVTSIVACPVIEDGPGRVVLTTVNHLNDFVFDLTLSDDGRTDTLGVTGNHRIYSEVRGWVAASELSEGEVVRTATGDAAVTSLVRQPGAFTVYNMTVEADHVYYVGDLSALVHNNCALRQSLGMRAGEAGQAAHVVPVGGWQSWRHPRAVRTSVAAAQNVLRRQGIGINDWHNGFIANAGHLGSHRYDFLRQLGPRLRRAEQLGGRDAILDALNDLKLRLHAGEFIR